MRVETVLRMHKSSPFCVAEGVDVRDEADEGTNAIDVDSLPRLPELSSPAAPQPPPPRQQQQQFVQVTFPIWSTYLPSHSSLISPQSGQSGLERLSDGGSILSGH